MNRFSMNRFSIDKFSITAAIHSLSSSPKSHRSLSVFAHQNPQQVEQVVSSFLESFEADAKDRVVKRVFSIHCLNEPGILGRVVNTLSSRGFNIDSLTVSPTNLPDLSRMTIVMNAVPEIKASQALKQLSDIVNVFAVVDYTGTNNLSRELLMVKVSYVPPKQSSNKAPSYVDLIDAQPHRTAVRDIGTLFGAEVVDVGTQYVVFQLVSWSRRIEAFITALEPFGIIETARSGVVTMLRSQVSGTEADQKSPQSRSATAVDSSQLPPG
jgi:acetolactate synthase I/III small subunit